MKEAQEKINELEERISKLEKIEKQRRTRKIISICIKCVFYIIVLIMLYRLYIYVKPYFEQVSQIKNVKDNLNLNSDSFGDLDLNRYIDELFN